MKLLRHRWIFGIAVMAGIGMVVLPAAYERWTRPPAAAVKRLTEQLALTEQLKLDQIPELRERFGTIIDLRPDGEAPDQPSAALVGKAARSNQLFFAYVPVPHGDIPDSAVAALRAAIASNPAPVLLYCRSGRRAARTWALVEASHPGGADAAAILAAVKASGQDATDLAPAIAQRITLRAAAAKEAP